MKYGIEILYRKSSGKARSMQICSAKAGRYLRM